MPQQCSELSYRLKRTDNQKEAYVIPKKSINSESTDINLIGKRRREYGPFFNENTLRLLENFSCPAENANDPIIDHVPDVLSAVSDDGIAVLSNPLEGQLWYNSSADRIFFYDGTNWIPLATTDDVGGNYGQLIDGESIPLPVSPNGDTFTYNECSWVVSPNTYPTSIDFMRCYTEETIDGAGNITDVRVKFQYRIVGETSVREGEGVANYQIVAIRKNSNLGSVQQPLP
jgi:hypothetical protein